FVPALIKLPLVFCNPIFGGVMRCMCCSRCVIHEPGLGGGQRMLHPHVSNGLIREIVIENVIWLPFVRFDRHRVLVERRMPLIAVAANESIEILKAQTSRPQIERSSLT